MALTSLGLASDGLLDRGDLTTLHMASLGHLRGGEIDPRNETGGGSGVGRLARAGYFSRPVSTRTWPRFYVEVPKKDRDEILTVEAETPPEVVKAVVNALDSVSATKTEARKPIGPKRKAQAVAQAEKEVGPVDEYNIDAMVRHYLILIRIEAWRQEEEDIALLLLSM